MRTLRAPQCFVLLTLLVCPLPVLAQKYPEKSIRLVVGYQTGVSYTVALILAEKLRESLGQALQAGLQPAIGEAVRDGRRPTGMAEDEEIVYDLLTEVFNNKGVSDPTYARAVAKFGEQGIIDLLGVAGYYTVLAMVMNVARTTVPEGPPLPLSPLPIWGRAYAAKTDV